MPFAVCFKTPVPDHPGLFLPLQGSKISTLEGKPPLTDVPPDSLPPGADLPRVQEPLRAEVSTRYTPLEPSRTPDDTNEQRRDRGAGGGGAGT
jgi:hypothetical protein